MADLQGERLDKFLAQREGELSRAQIAGLVSRGFVTVNGAVAKSSYRVRGGDSVEMELPPPAPDPLSAQDIPLAVVYEDDDLLVVDKSAGMVVHPAPGHSANTLVNALLGLLPDIRDVGEEARPGIVHRLDKDTSGLMVVAKSRFAYQHVSQQLKDRTVHKTYAALLRGVLEPAHGVIRASLGRDRRNRQRMALVSDGRDAETEYRVVERLSGCTLVDAFPKTGRTHQIRVHFSSLGHPVLGDLVYGGKDPRLSRQFLHARSLGFHLPTTGEYREFHSPLPLDLETVLGEIRSLHVGATRKRASINSTGGR